MRGLIEEDKRNNNCIVLDLDTVDVLAVFCVLWNECGAVSF
jgi:hypothetical protein